MGKIVEENSDEEVYRKLLKELEIKTGICLDGYRTGVARRRIGRRVRALDLRGLRDYLIFIRRNPDEARELARQITLPVSRFFRNRRVYSDIRDKVFPEIFEKAGESEKIYIWSAGCGEGEEPYSVAMVLLENFSAEVKKYRIKILGTDINEGAIEKARAGCYDEGRLEGVSASTRRKYFIQDGEKHWRVSGELRPMVQFARESLPLGRGLRKCSLVLMRNLLIYFDRDRQEKMFARVTDSLKTGGFLVIGKSETILDGYRKKYDTISSPNRIYRKAAR